MKPIRILLIATLAAIMCCSLTSCEEQLITSELTFTNTTSKYCMQLYCDGQELFSDTYRLWPGKSQIHSNSSKTSGNYWNFTKYPVDIKIEWYEMTGNQTFKKTPSHSNTKQNCRFNLGTNYKVTIRDKDFTIQPIY